MHPWQTCLRKFGKKFAKAAKQFPKMRLALVSVPNEASLNSSIGQLGQINLYIRSMVTQACWDWEIDIEKGPLPTNAEENGVVLIGDQDAIERFRFLVLEAVANLPNTFWIRPALFPTQLPHLAEESRLHRWAEFVLIASSGSWRHRIDDPAKPENRFSYTLRNAFGASSDAIQEILGDPTSDANLHQLNASRLLATFNGDKLPDECLPFASPPTVPPRTIALQHGEGEKLKSDATMETIPPTMLSASDIANRIKKNVKSVTSFLTRFTNKHPDCRIENATKRKNEPRYLYRTDDVWPALKIWMKDDTKE